MRGSVSHSVCSPQLPAASSLSHVKGLSSARCSLAIAPLFGTFVLAPGSTAYLVAVALAGALSYASIPLMAMGAQDLAPRQMAAGSGMLLGFSSGVAGRSGGAVLHTSPVSGVTVAEQSEAMVMSNTDQ